MLPFNRTVTFKPLIAGLFSLFILLSACQENTTIAPDYSKNLKRGEIYLQQGQYKAAIIEAKNALQKAPLELTSNLLMARILLEIGQPQAALEQLKKIKGNREANYVLATAETFIALTKYNSAERLLEKNEALLTSSNQIRYLDLFIQSQLGQANIDKAQSLIQQILTLEPAHANAQVSLAIIAINKGDIPLAEQYLTNVLTENPENIKALLLRAKIARATNDLAGSENALTIALNSLSTSDIMTSQRATILTSLAEVLTQQGRNTEAMVYTRIVNDALPGQIALNSKFEDALGYLSTEQIDAAETLLEEILLAAPNYQPARQILGIIKYNRGEFEAANNYFADTLDAETAPENATLAFAMTSLQLNDPERVLNLLEDQIDDISNAQLLGIYGLAALSANQSEKGQQALHKALSIDPKLSRIRLILAKTYNFNGEIQLALQQLQTAYQVSPEDPLTQKALIRQYLSLDQRDNADKFVASLSEEHPDNASSQILIGSYQDFSGNSLAAIASLKRALKIEPENSEAMASLGALYIKTAQYLAATEHYRHVIKALPTLAIGYKGLFSSLELEDKKQQAIDEILAMAKTSAHIAPYSVLIEYYARNALFDSANEILTEAQQQFSEDSGMQQLQVKLAGAEAQHAFQNGRLTRARQVASKGLQTKPDDTSLKTLLVEIEVAAQNFQKATELTSGLSENHGNLAMLLSGKIATAQGEQSIALNHYQALWKLQPSNNLARRIYGNLIGQKKSADSTAFLVEWEERFPNTIEILTAKSAVAIGNQNYPAAIMDINRAIKLQGRLPSPALLNNLAWAYLQTDNFLAAEQHSSRAYAIAPKIAEIADTYGWVLLKAGKHDKAKEILEIASNLAPGNAEIASHLKEARDM